MNIFSYIRWLTIDNQYYNKLYQKNTANITGPPVVQGVCTPHHSPIQLPVRSWQLRPSATGQGWHVASTVVAKATVGDVPLMPPAPFNVIFIKEQKAKEMHWGGEERWIHPGRLTWNIIMEVWKMIFLSKWVIYRFHVILPGCRSRTLAWCTNVHVFFSALPFRAQLPNDWQVLEKSM